MTLDAVQKSSQIAKTCRSCCYFSWELVLGLILVTAEVYLSNCFRVRLVKNEDAHYRPRIPHSRRSIFTHTFRNDNDYNSSRFDNLRAPVSDTSSAEPKALKVHQPRENPRLFYQSDTYAKEVIANSLNNAVAAVYPGKDVVWASEHYYRKTHPARLRERGLNEVPYGKLDEVVHAIIITFLIWKYAYLWLITSPIISQLPYRYFLNLLTFLGFRT